MSDIEFFTTGDGRITVEVRADGESVWLSRQQMAVLFGRDVKTIGKHIAAARNEELAEVSTVAKFATVQLEGGRSVQRRVEHYNLDMILSVGYRVKSSQGVQFRRWANEILKRYVLEGAALNEQRLEQLGSIVHILSRSPDQLVSGVADVLGHYLPSLTLLRDYDDGSLQSPAGARPEWTLTLEDARQVISGVASKFPSDRLLGQERGDGLETIVAAIYQGFAGQELYASVEEKAANLLYLVVKDHPLADGNKRSAAALFVTFLAHNGLLKNRDGSRRVANNALAAVTLMVAMSQPAEKDLMVALVMRMITD